VQCRKVAVKIPLVRLAPGRSRAAPSPEQEEVDVAAGNREQKRVVVPPLTLPKNVIAVLTRAGEPSGWRRFGGLLFHLVCAQETEREKLRVLLDCDCRKLLTEGGLLDL